ncbi:hypothetical protein [Mycobacterium sp.]|uniref:hypothetical protein n=1 Tax=Mycobacterium sp. TaxID=1785 RepID=UPI003D6AEABF
MTEEAPDRKVKPGPVRSLWVAKLAAQAAVTASKKSGRPLDPRVKKLAELPDQPGC